MPCHRCISGHVCLHMYDVHTSLCILFVRMHMIKIPMTIIAANSNPEEKFLFMDEIKVMKKVSNGNNPHILKMLGCITATNPMMLILQYVPHGNLKNYLKPMKPVAVYVRALIVCVYVCVCVHVLSLLNL